MAPPPFQQQGPVAMSGTTHARQTPTQYRQQHSYTLPQSQQQPQHAPPQYHTYRPPQQEQEEDGHESYDSTDDTDEEDDDQYAYEGSRPMFGAQAHHSLLNERPTSKYADPPFSTAPYRPPPGVPVSSTSQQRKNAPVSVGSMRSMLEPTSISARPIPVPPSRRATHHEFNASVGVGLGSSPTSRAHNPTTSNSSFGAGSYGSGSLGDRGAKHRPPVHDEWRATDAAVVSSSPATATTKPSPEDWVRTLRVEHETQKKRARLELQAKILDIAKREGDAIVHGYLEKDEFDAARERARGEFTRQMEILDGQLRDAIASRRGRGDTPSADVWEENLRQEQEIIMQQIARERRASVGNDAHDARPQLLERGAELRTSGLPRRREEVGALERQIAQEREDVCRKEAAIVDTARKREAARRLDEVPRQQAAARSSMSSARTPQRPIPMPTTTVQSESESDDDQAEEDEDENASSSSEEHASTSRAPSQSTPSPALVHSTAQQPAPKIQRKGEPPPIRPPVARYDSYPTDSPAPPKPRLAEEGPADKPIPHEREHGPYSQSFVNERREDESRDDERMRKEQEFVRRAEEAKNRYQERKRAEEEEKERERVHRATGRSRTPSGGGSTSNSAGAGSLGGWSPSVVGPGSGANQNWRATTTSTQYRRWIPPPTASPPHKDSSEVQESGVCPSSTVTPPWKSASRRIQPGLGQ